MKVVVVENRGCKIFTHVGITHVGQKLFLPSLVNFLYVLNCDWLKLSNQRGLDIISPLKCCIVIGQLIPKENRNEKDISLSLSHFFLYLLLLSLVSLPLSLILSFFSFSLFLFIFSIFSISIMFYLFINLCLEQSPKFYNNLFLFVGLKTIGDFIRF